MRLPLSSLLLAVILLAPLSRARAEKVDLPPNALLEVATHVVQGTVVHVYERKSREGAWRYTHYLAEVRVDVIEKGEGLTAGGLLYARYWRRSYVGGDMPPSTSGHRGLPAEGASTRIYLARNAYDGFGETQDGGFNVIGANGFEALRPAGD